MNTNQKKKEAMETLQVEEKTYMDFDARSDEVKLWRPKEEQRFHLKVNDEEFTVGRLTSAVPLSAGLERVVFFDTEGDEIGCLKNASCLDGESLKLLREELDKAYFMPSIERIEEITDHLGLELWKVKTNRGERSFEVRQPRKNVRIISPKRMIVKDVDGNRYEIKDWRMLDKNSLSSLMRHL